MSFEARADRTVALALATTMLSGGWWHETLVEQAQRTLGRSDGWLDRLVQEILVLFPEAPLQAPRALVDVISYSDTFLRAAHRGRTAGDPLRVVPRAQSSEPRPVSRPEPRIDDLTQLAAWLELSPGQLRWLADPGGYQLRTRPGPLHVYEYVWTPRAGGAPRLLEAPTPILKRVQRELLHRLLARLPVHKAAHGFVPGRSVLTHARRHLGAEVVVTADISNFFARIGPSRLQGILRTAGYPDEVARCLVALCSTRTPAWVLQRMPPGGTGDARYALRTRLRAPHLPQGAPTSPALANLACRRLDARLAGYVTTLDGVYSRYADDLTFSGEAPLRLAGPAVIAAIGRIVADEGFRLNPAKTRVQPRSQRQVVTGVVVNERLNVTRQQFDQLRAVLHEARTRGPEAANRTGHLDFRGHLTGRVAWVESLNRPRGQRLRADLDAISWPEPGQPR